MRWRAAPVLAALLLAGCDALPAAITSAVACQQRIVEVRSAELLDPAGAADIAGSFSDLAARYAAVSRKDCNEAQKKRLEQLEAQVKNLARLAGDATKASQSASARKERLPNSEAQIAFMTALQEFENRQSQLRRELREMHAN